MIQVQVLNTHPRCRIRRKETVRVVRRILLKERRSKGSFAVIFLNDARMKKLNSEFLGRRSSTDVLSFALEEERKRAVEGEVYVNVDRARRQARDYNVSFADEIRRLVVHGMLHLVGYDDATAREKKTMARLEDYYLKSR